MTKTLAAVERTLAAARSKLGTLEEPTNRCEFNRWYYDADVSAAWCATGVSWSMFQGCGHAPVPASTAKGFAFVPSGVVWAKNHGGCWLPNKTGKWVGQPGDLTVFSFGGERPDHVELCEARGDKAGTYVDIGFNTLRPGAAGNDASGGGVWRRVRNTKIVGFIRPPYPADEAPTPQPPHQEDDDMDYALCNEDNGFWFVISGNTRRRVSGPNRRDETLQEIRNVGMVRFPKNPNVSTGHLADVSVPAGDDD